MVVVGELHVTLLWSLWPIRYHFRLWSKLLDRLDRNKPARSLAAVADVDRVKLFIVDQSENVSLARLHDDSGFTNGFRVG
jgi:hypothetical protein